MLPVQKQANPSNRFITLILSSILHRCQYNVTTSSAGNLCESSTLVQIAMPRALMPPFHQADRMCALTGCARPQPHHLVAQRVRRAQRPLVDQNACQHGRGDAERCTWRSRHQRTGQGGGHLAAPAGCPHAQRPGKPRRTTPSRRSRSRPCIRSRSTPRQDAPWRCIQRIMPVRKPAARMSIAASKICSARSSSSIPATTSPPTAAALTATAVATSYQMKRLHSRRNNDAVRSVGSGWARSQPRTR